MIHLESYRVDLARLEAREHEAFDLLQNAIREIAIEEKERAEARSVELVGLGIEDARKRPALERLAVVEMRVGPEERNEKRAKRTDVIVLFVRFVEENHVFVGEPRVVALRRL